MRFRAIRVGILLSLPFFGLAARAATKTVTFAAYQAFSDAERQKLARRYVRKVGEYWQVRLASYIVRTDVSAEATLGAAVKMDEFYRKFTRIFVGPFRIRARPELFVLKDTPAYQSAIRTWSEGRISTPGWSAGMFVYVGHRYALFGCAKWGDERLYNTLFHEGTHHLLRFYIGVEFPRWFNEGVATNFETWDVGFSSERNVYEELWRSERVVYLYGMATGKIKGIEAKKPDLIALMASSDEGWLESANPHGLYAEAWGFVNFLLSSGATGQRNFNVLIRAFRSGQQMRKVLPTHIRMALASQYNAYVSDVIIPHCEFSVPVAGLLREGRIADAAKALEVGLGKHPENTELLFFKGFLALRAGKVKEAYVVLKPLEKRFPRHPLLMRVLGEAALVSGDRFKARKWLKLAVGEDFRDEHARALLEKAKKPAGR